EPVQSPIVAGARDDVGEAVAVDVVHAHLATTTAEHGGGGQFRLMEWPRGGVDAGCGLFVPTGRHDDVLTAVAIDVADTQPVTVHGLAGRPDRMRSPPGRGIRRVGLRPRVAAVSGS